MEVVEEMKKLRELLDEKQIVWEDISEDFSTSAIPYKWICGTWFKYNGRGVTCINGIGTYGGCNASDNYKENRGLIEMMIHGKDGEGKPIGYLTAEDCMEILEEKFKNRKK